MNHPHTQSSAEAAHYSNIQPLFVDENRAKSDGVWVW
jgi:hypothetical protein